MSDNTTPTLNKGYIISVSVLTFIFPVIAASMEMQAGKGTSFTFLLIGKWFIFSAVGLRLFIAGIRQTTNPAFTAREIFHIETTDSFPIVRELGFANLCFGLTGLISLFMPQWRVVSAFSSGLYYGTAGFQHLFKKPAGANEAFALVTDLFIFIILLICFIQMI